MEPSPNFQKFKLVQGSPTDSKLPTDPATLQLRAICKDSRRLLEQGDIEEALIEARKAETLANSFEVIAPITRVVVLNQLGVSLIHSRQYEEAEGYLLHALALSQKIDLATHLTMALNTAVLFKRTMREATPEAAPRSATSFVDMVQGTVNRTRGLVQEPIEKAHLGRIELELGVFYGGQGKFSEAEKLILDAIGLEFEAGCFKDAALMATTLGSLRARQGRIKEAEKTYAEALIFAQSQKPQDISLLSRTYLELGRLHAWTASFEAALPPLNNALDVLRTEDGSELVSAQVLPLTVRSIVRANVESVESAAEDLKLARQIAIECHHDGLDEMEALFQSFVVHFAAENQLKALGRLKALAGWITL